MRAQLAREQRHGLRHAEPSGQPSGYGNVVRAQRAADPPPLQGCRHNTLFEPEAGEVAEAHGEAEEAEEAGEAARLRQRLAAVQHEAAQRRIELEAAAAKLAIYRGHAARLAASAATSTFGRQQPCACRQGAASPMPASPPPPGASRIKSRIHAAQESPAAGSGGLSRPRLVRLHPVAPEGVGAVELCLLGARLQEGALPPGALTFLAVDFYAHSTQLTQLAEGE